MTAAPLGLSASAADSQRDVQVSYVAGGLTPDNTTGNYVVTIPSSVVFTAQDEEIDMSVGLTHIDTSVALPTDLEVQVDVFSANGYKLKNAQYPTVEGVYTLRYDTNLTAGDGQGVAGADDYENTMANAAKTTGADNDLAHANAANGDIVGVLEDDKTDIGGLATLTTAPAVNADGVAFTDTLTYYVAQLAPTVQP